MNNIAIEDIYYQSGLRYFNNNVKFLIQNVLLELYDSDYPLLSNIKLKHVDRAVFKYKQAADNKKIYNTKNYFKACLKSSLEELGIDEY
jgi:Zn/Cd-binding protein ZinT